MKDRFKRLKKVVDDYELQQEDRQIELRMYKVRWIWYHTIQLLSSLKTHFLKQKLKLTNLQAYTVK